MANFRLNATKPNKNAGLPTPKSELYLLYVEDIISMPTANPKGVITEGNIVIADGRRFHVLYLTPSTQTHNRDTEGDVDSRGWKKKITGHYPGDEIEINEFVKNNTNQGFVIVSKTCNSEYKRIYGSKCNPLYFTGAYVDDSEKKGYELTFEQEFADNDPVLFYNGNILIDEDALNPSGLEAASSIFVKLDASNITPNNKNLLKKALDIGEMPTNAATIDEGDKEGTVYTKTQADKLVKNIANSTLNTTKEGGVNQLYSYKWSIAQGSMFSMYAGEDLGLGVKDTSFRLSNGYFNVAQGTGSGRTEFTVTKNGIKLSYNINHDSDDDIYTSIGIEGGKIYFDGVNRIDEENNPEPIRQLVMDSMGWVYYKPLVQNSLQSAINGGAQATSQQRITLESIAVTGNSYYIACGFGSSTIGSFSTGNYSIFNRIDVRDNMIDMMAHKRDGFSNFQITPDGWTSSISNIAYSNFSVSRRGLNIGKGLLNNADGDITFDKILVYKADGSVGVESKPKIRRYILNRDIIVNSVPQTSTDLYVPIEPGKLYRLKACFKLGNRNTTYRFMRLYSSDLTTHYQSMGGIFQLTINSGDSGNSDIGSSNIGTHSLILEGLIRFDVSTIIKNNLVINTSDSNLFITLERGTYIEIEEII